MPCLLKAEAWHIIPAVVAQCPGVLPGAADVGKLWVFLRQVSANAATR